MSDTADALILEARDGDVVTLTFNDPDHRNAMTTAMGEAFAGVVARIGRDETIRALVLTGGGSAFSAGGDMGMISDRAAEGQAQPGIARRAIRDTMRAFYKLFLSIRDVPCPTIAAINGHAIGAGFCVALACDMRFAAAQAKLALNFTKLGLHPGMGATWTVPRLVGPALAAEVLYTSRIFSGSEAAEIGLVNRALPTADVLPTAQRVAAEIAGCAPLAVRGVKRALDRSLAATLEDQLSFEASEQSVCFESQDVLEGIEAGKARRPPRFEGR